MTMLKAQYDRRGPVPHEVIRAVPFELPPPAPGQALVAMLASPINPANLLTLTGEYRVAAAAVGWRQRGCRPHCSAGRERRQSVSRAVGAVAVRQQSVGYAPAG